MRRKKCVSHRAYDRYQQLIRYLCAFQPFLTKAEHDKLQYEAARKLYEDKSNVMTGTGYIIPDNEPIPDVTAAIFAARLSHRDTFATTPAASTAPPPTVTAKSTVRPRSATRYAPVPAIRRTRPPKISKPGG